MSLSQEVRGSGRRASGGLAARVLAGSVLVGSMGGCLGPVGGYIVGKEIARGQERAQYNDYVRQHNATTVDGRLWKGQPLESYAATLNERTFGRLEIHPEGIQFDTEGITIGNRPVPFWWTSVPYSSINNVSYSEGRIGLLTYIGEDTLGIKWRDANGRIQTYQFVICDGNGQEDIFAEGLANRVQERVNKSGRGSSSLQFRSLSEEEIRQKAIAFVDSEGIADPVQREKRILEWEKFVRTCVVRK